MPSVAGGSRARRRRRRVVPDVNLIHCSYHKCLTVYYRRVMGGVLNRCLRWRGPYRHYNSHLEEFYAGFEADRLASVNNRSVDLDRLGEFRLTRFVRDPRDLVVSGYFYHRRGAEDWTRIRSPTEVDWYFANGRVPESLRAGGQSFAQLLRSVSREEGLLAELEFRAPHFESMAAWPARHPDILTLRYEDVVADGERAFAEMASFYGLSPIERRLTGWFARRYSLARGRADAHVRNPAPGQWREVFTPRVRRTFDAAYGALVAQLGYPAD